MFSQTNMSRTENFFINRQPATEANQRSPLLRMGSLSICETLANTDEVDLPGKSPNARKYNLPRLNVREITPPTAHKSASPIPTACSDSLTQRSTMCVQDDTTYVQSSDRYELTLGNDKKVSATSLREEPPMRTRGGKDRSFYENSMGESLKQVKRERSRIEDKIKSLTAYNSMPRDYCSDLYDSPYSQPRNFGVENVIDFAYSSPEQEPQTERSEFNFKEGVMQIEHEVSKIEKLCSEEFIDTESMFSAYSNIDKAYGVLNKVYNKVLALQQDNSYLKKEIERLEKKLVIEKERYDILSNAYKQDRLAQNERYELEMQIQTLKNENDKLNDQFENCVNLLKREKTVNDSIRKKIEENEQLMNSLQDKVKAVDMQDEIRDRLMIEKRKIEYLEKILEDKKKEISTLMQDKEKLIYDNQILKQQTEHDLRTHENLDKMNEKLLEQLETAEKEKKESEKKVENLKKDIKTSKEKLEFAHREIKEYLSMNEKLKGENAKIKEKNEKSEDKVSLLESRNAALMKELEKMKLEQVKFKAQIEKLEQLNGLIEGQVKSDQARCVQLAKQYDETVAEYRKLQTENNKLNMHNQNLLESLTAEREKYLEVMKSYETHKAESNKVGLDLDQFHREKACLAEQLLSESLKADNLQEVITEKTCEIAKLNLQLNQAKSLLKDQENLKTEIEKLKSDLTSSKLDSSSLEIKLTESRNEVQLLTGCIEHYKQLLQENSLTVQKLSTIVEYKNKEIKTLSVISVQVQCLRQENVKKQQELFNLHSLLQSAEIRFNTVYSSYQKLDQDYKHILSSQTEIKNQQSIGKEIADLQDLLSQERVLNQNLEIQLRDQSIMIKQLSEMEDDYKQLMDENEKMRADLEDYEENIKYIESEKMKLEYLQLETQKCIETYKEEVKNITEMRVEEINLLTQTLHKSEKKNNSLMELLENQREKITELTEEISRFQEREENFSYPMLDVEQIKIAIQEHIEEIVREHHVPLNAILLSIKNNEAKILSLEAKFFKILNYIRKLNETKQMFETSDCLREQAIAQICEERVQLQADREKYEKEILPEMKNIIQSLESELNSAKSDLKSAEKEISSLTSKLNSVEAGDYSELVKELTSQLLSREKEVELITSQCNNLRKEYQEMSLTHEELADFLAVLPVQKLKLQELEQQLSSNIRDLESTLSLKNDEISRMSLHNKKLVFNIDSMAKSIEYQSVVILDLQSHLREIEGFYLNLQKKLNELFHSLPTDSQSTTAQSKEAIHNLTEKVRQLDESLSKDLKSISNATQTALNKVKFPYLSIDLDRDSLFNVSSGSDTERLLRFSQYNEKSEYLDSPSANTLKAAHSIEIIDDEVSRSPS
jgi:chromosome segregation ATPase